MDKSVDWPILTTWWNHVLYVSFWNDDEIQSAEEGCERQLKYTEN